MYLQSRHHTLSAILILYSDVLPGLQDLIMIIMVVSLAVLKIISSTALHVLYTLINNLHWYL